MLLMKFSMSAMTVDNYDDVIIEFSDDMDPHINDLMYVFKQLKSSAGFTLRDSKCLLGLHPIAYLGFHYSVEGVGPLEDKPKAIAEWLVPASAKELKSFIGFANFYQNFVPGFADISSLLNALISKKTTFTWTAKHQTTFDTLQQSLMFSPILDCP